MNYVIALFFIGLLSSTAPSTLVMEETVSTNRYEIRSYRVSWNTYNQTGNFLLDISDTQKFTLKVNSADEFLVLSDILSTNKKCYFIPRSDSDFQGTILGDDIKLPGQ